MRYYFRNYATEFQKNRNKHQMRTLIESEMPDSVRLRYVVEWSTRIIRILFPEIKYVCYT